MSTRTDKEQVIFEAARKVFVEKGPARARIKDIADEAGITPSLFHYYFRNRDELFDAVVREELEMFLTEQIRLLQDGLSLEEKLTTFARDLIDFHLHHPHQAAFTAFEAYYSTERLDHLGDLFAQADFDRVQQQIDARAEAGDMAPMSARHLMMHLISMCLFPFVARPIYCRLFGLEPDAFWGLMEERKTLVPQFVRDALRGSAQR